MIDQKDIVELVETWMQGTDKFLVSLVVKPGNRILVFIDGDAALTIDDCVQLSRHIESNLDREKEDFELSVSSSGADQPLVMPRQYSKHIGRMLKVKAIDGSIVTGVLEEVEKKHFVLKTPAVKKEKKAEAKVSIEFENVKETKIELSFK